jgi:alanyl-tRNA synthetase
MDSASIRQSFQDFFKSKGHAIVPSASLLPTAPNLLFTNAGMNPFVPYFLGEREAPESRVADTQKCIRAGGKHNDLEDVGFDTYHHTFFEMLGNWSFGDYFKKEAIEWAWELLTKVWKLPKERLYVTVYQPAKGDPATFDQEAYDLWKALLEKDGLDPSVHIIYGNAKDNFWMMGDTGPCGPCSEIHIDLTEKGDTKGGLVNQDSAYCMEIWNLVFIQFNAKPDGSFEPLRHKHVDTGMGLERVAGIFATTKKFTEYGRVPSNYDSDLFTVLFDHVGKLCGKCYKATVPESKSGLSEQEQIDIRMRALGDHIRAVCFAIGDGILPGNEGRNYVIRHILRRGILAAQRLGLKTGDFTKLSSPLIAKMGTVFPELLERRDLIQKVLSSEEETFYKTLEKGLQMLDRFAQSGSGTLDGQSVFSLYDTYGFPVEMTQMIAQERDLKVDIEGFNEHMEAQRERARSAQKKTVITVKSGDQKATDFVGYSCENWSGFACKIVAVESGESSKIAVEKTPFYGEKGGQVGDRGSLQIDGKCYNVTNTTIDPNGIYLHHVDANVSDGVVGKTALLTIDETHRRAIQRHHTATHLLHWALRLVVGDHVHQAGSMVSADRLRFDFSHYEKLSTEQIAKIEHLVIGKILANDPVIDFETPFDQKPEDVLAFFEDKYGDVVRVVDIGGYSKELCAGTHTRTTGEIGMIRIVQESAIAAGSRRIEALAGDAFVQWMEEVAQAVNLATQALKCQPSELSSRVSDLIEERKQLQKSLSDLRMSEASKGADSLVSSAVEQSGIKWVKGVLQASNPNELKGLAVRLQKSLGEGVVLVGAEIGDKATVICSCSPEAIAAGCNAGSILRGVMESLGGKGGGKPDFAMGGAKAGGALDAAVRAAVAK